MKVKANYVSVWDGSYKIESNCEYDPTTNDVTDIETVDVDDLDLDALWDEYVELPDGTQIREFTIEGEER